MSGPTAWDPLVEDALRRERDQLRVERGELREALRTVECERDTANKALAHHVEEVERLSAEVGELARALDDATGPHCPTCGNAIDPDTCHCGVATSDPGHDNHAPIPMGCVCGYIEPDWQSLATTRGEHLHRLRKEVAQLRGKLGRIADLVRPIRSRNEPAGAHVVKMILDETFVESTAAASTAPTPRCGAKVVPGRKFPGPHFVCELPRGHAGDHAGESVVESEEQPT